MVFGLINASALNHRKYIFGGRRSHSGKAHPTHSPARSAIGKFAMYSPARATASLMRRNGCERCDDYEVISGW